MTVLWLVGEPGIGKTTVSRIFMALYGTYRFLDDPKQKWTATDNFLTKPAVVAAGHYTGAMFDGGDTVGYSSVRAALEFWHTLLAPSFDVTLFDGDRFSYEGVVEFMQLHAPTQRLVCARITGSGEARRLARGTKQNASWLKGRTTKVNNFVAAFPGEVLLLDGSATPSQIAVSLKESLK